MATKTFDITVSVRDTSTDVIVMGKKASSTYTSASSKSNGGRMSIGTSETTITIPADIGNAGMCYVENHDATNYMKLGFATGNYVHRIPPLQKQLVWLEPTVSTLYAIANVAAVEATVLVAEA